MTNLTPIALSSQLDETGEEKIHAATANRIVRPVFTIPPLSVYAAIANTMKLFKSSQGSAFAITTDSGVLSTTSSVRVGRAGGDLYHMANQGQAVVTSDGTSWQALTGLPTSFFTPGIGDIAKYNGEWLLGASGKLYVATDGLNFSERSASFSGAVKERLGDMWLYAAGNTVIYSTDNWLTTTTYSLGSVFYTFGGLLDYLAVPGFGFFLFGYNASGQAIIAYSPTGLSGTWTVNNAPWTGTYTARSVYDRDTGRVWICITGSTSFNATVYYAEAGSTTFQSFGSFPYGSRTDPGSNLEVADGWLYKSAPQGSGLNTIYTSPVTASNWQAVYSVSGGNAVNSLCAWRPGYE